jgi:methionine synthase II (cobalamin-independent)
MWKILMVISLLGCGGEPKDWTGKKLVTETLTLEGVTFTIDVPEGLPKDKRNPSDWSDAREEYDHVPKVFTSVWSADSMPADVDSAMHTAALRIEDAHFIRKDKRPDGWALTDANPDKHRIEAWTIKKAGADKVIKCTAVQVMDGELPSYDKTKAMLEAICDSVKPK